LDITEILLRLDALALQKETVLIAIDGGSGSGKTTLAALLAAERGCNIFHMDDFFLRPSQRTDERLAEIGGYTDYERFKTEVLDKIIEGNAFSYRAYDCKVQSYKEAVCVSPKKISIVEGSYSRHPYFDDVWDLKIFVSAPREIRLSRIKERSGDKLFEHFVTDWIPREDAYFSKFRIEETSDLVVVND
jgi:uridine kinase